MVTLRVYFFHLIKQKQVIQRLSPACLTAINWYPSGQHSQSMAAFAQWGLCHPLASTTLAAEPWPLPVPDLVLKAEEKTASPLLASMVLGAEGHLLHPQLSSTSHQCLLHLKDMRAMWSYHITVSWVVTVRQSIAALFSLSFMLSLPKLEITAESPPRL